MGVHRLQVRRPGPDKLARSSGIIWWDGRTWRFRRVGEDEKHDRVELDGELPSLHWFNPRNPHHTDADLETAGTRAVADAGFWISPESCWLIERPEPTTGAPVALARAA